MGVMMICPGGFSEPRLLIIHALGFLNTLHLSTWVRGEKRGVGRCINGAGVDRDLKTDPGRSLVLSCLVCSEDWTQIVRLVWQALLPAGSSHWPHAHLSFYHCRFTFYCCQFFNDTPYAPKILHYFLCHNPTVQETVLHFQVCIS